VVLEEEEERRKQRRRKKGRLRELEEVRAWGLRVRVAAAT
jgi:hypothetical protein